MPEPVSDAHVDQVVSAIRVNIDLSALTLPEEYFYASLPLCVIDAVFSIGANYSSVRNTVHHWCEAQTPPWAISRAETDREHTISQFLLLASRHAPDELAQKTFRNTQRTSTRGGILKAEAVVSFAAVMQRHGIETFESMRKLTHDIIIEREVRAIRGQTSGLSWDYFRMLSGSDDRVKPDRMICRFIGRALRLRDPVLPGYARELLTKAAHRLRDEAPGVTLRAIDYAIWQRERTQAAN